MMLLREISVWELAILLCNDQCKSKPLRGKSDLKAVMGLRAKNVSSQGKDQSLELELNYFSVKVLKELLRGSEKESLILWQDLWKEQAWLDFLCGTVFQALKNIQNASQYQRPSEPLNLFQELSHLMLSSLQLNHFFLWLSVMYMMEAQDF